MARAPEKTAEQEERSAEVVYVDDEGPNRTSIGGIEFKLNVPVKVPYSKTILQLHKKESIGPEGEPRSRSVEVRVPLVEVLRGNPGFSIDGVRHERKLGTQRLPTDSDQYRGYALSWIRATNTLTQLNQRWDGEEALREKCGCEPKDVSYLAPFLEARREQLSEAA